jgi:hypothetical protein
MRGRSLDSAFAGPSAFRAVQPTSARSLRIRSSREAPCRCRTRARASTPSPPRTAHSAGSTRSPRRTTGRTGSRSSMVASTPRPTRPHWRSMTRPGSCSGSAASRTGTSSSSRSRPWSTGPRVLQHPGLPARRPRRAVGALPADREARLAVPDDRAAVAEPAGGRRRRLVSGRRRRARRCLCRDREPVAVGRVEGVPERRALRRSHALHRLARRPLRGHRPAALARPGDGARHSRLRLPGFPRASHDRRAARRLLRREGRPRRGVGSLDPRADLVASRRHAPARPRAAAATADHRVSRSPGRRVDADGVCRRAALRPGRRALQPRERRHHAERIRPLTGARQGRSVQPSTRRRGESRGSGGSGRRRSAVRPWHATP